MVFLVTATNLITLFLGLEWFLDLALHPLRNRLRPRRLARGGSQVPRRRRLRLGIPALRSALVYGSTGESASARSPGRRRSWPQARRAARRRPGDDHPPVSVQGVGSAVPHVDTGRLRGAPTPVTGFMAAATKATALVLTLRFLTTAFPQEKTAVDGRARRRRGRLAGNREPGGARAAEREAAARILVDLARGLHAHPDRGRGTPSAGGRFSTT